MEKQSELKGGGVALSLTAGQIVYLILYDLTARPEMNSGVDSRTFVSRTGPLVEARVSGGGSTFLTSCRGMEPIHMNLICVVWRIVLATVQEAASGANSLATSRRILHPPLLVVCAHDHTRW